MRIGVDIDNVISNFDDVLLQAYLEHDKSLRNKGIIRKCEVVRKKFDWSEEEERSFYQNNLEKIAKNFEPVLGASKYIKLLRNKGHEIYIVSGRDNGEYSDPWKMTEDWLKKYDIEYDKLILTNAYNTHEKTDVCLKNNIKILIDDSKRICMDAYYFGVDALLMDMPHNRDNKVLTRVRDWKEIYEYIDNYRKDKFKVILDTDTFNEADDQFALSYMFKSQDVFDIEAITIAPFRNKERFYNDSGIEKSYEEAKKLCCLLGVDNFDKIYKGSTDYIINGYEEKNKAVEKIIEIALKNEKTYILGIAAITNVALAIRYEPKIIDKIEIIWLGGHTPMYPNNLNEANFKDIEAVRTIFESKVKLTVIPCKGVASNLETTLCELRANMDETNELNKYLISGFERYINTYRHEQRWPIWDIAVIAYMINPMWFVRCIMKTPSVNKDYAYEDNYGDNEMVVVSYLSSNKIYKDMFARLSDYSKYE